MLRKINSNSVFSIVFYKEKQINYCTSAPLSIYSIFKNKTCFFSEQISPVKLISSMLECIHEVEELRVKEGGNNRSPKGIDGLYFDCMCSTSHQPSVKQRLVQSLKSPLQIHDLNQVHVASLLVLQGEGAFSCCYWSI